MIDKIVGNYRIVERLGDGGMGSVYRAVDRMLDREVAIKVLRPELARQASLVERFRQEAIALARLSHPHIATLHGLEEHDGQLLMIMEYVRGETLEAIVQRSGRVAWARACELCIAVLDALDHAHDKGVVHRDIKPANVMLSNSGVVKVMDFGIARMLGRSRQTQFGHAVGTPMYMAPEQLRGQEVDGRTDLYAVGAVLFELVTGRMAFEADSDYSLMMKKLNEAPIAPSSYVRDVPSRIDDIVMKAMETQPDQRFPNAVAFAQELEDTMHALNAPSRRPIPATRLGGGSTPPRTFTLPEPRDISASSERAHTPVAETRLAGSQTPVQETRLADARDPSVAETRLAGATNETGVGVTASHAQPHTQPHTQSHTSAPLIRDWRTYAVAGAIFVGAAVAVRTWRSPAPVADSTLVAADTSRVTPRDSAIAQVATAPAREDASSLIIQRTDLPPASDPVGVGSGQGSGGARPAPPAQTKKPPTTPPSGSGSGSGSGSERTEPAPTQPPADKGNTGRGTEKTGGETAVTSPVVVDAPVVESASAARANIARALSSALSDLGDQSTAAALLQGDSRSEWLALAKEGRVSASAAGSPDIDVQDGQATATIDANVNVRSPFGANKKRSARFTAALQKSSSGWRVTSIRPVGSLSLK